MSSLNEAMAAFYGKMPKTKQRMRGAMATGDEIRSVFALTGAETDAYDLPRSLAGCSRTIVVRGKARRVSCRRGA